MTVRKGALAVLAICTLAACTNEIDPKLLMERSVNPFVEYEVTNPKEAAQVESGILEREAQKNGLDTAKTSAHMISLKKIGTYGSGEVMIMGELTANTISKLTQQGIRTSGIVSYKCEFEYDFKRGNFIWTSNFPYKLPEPTGDL